MNKRSFWAQRPLVCIALSFGVGLAVGLKGMFSLWPAAALGAICSGLLAALSYRQQHSIAFGMCGLCFFLAVLYGTIAARPAVVPQGKMAVEGAISGCAHVRESDGRIQAVLRPAVVQKDNGSSYTLPAAYWTFQPGKERIKLYDGQRVRFTGKVYRPSGRVNPYGFDFALYLRQKGITAGITGARNMTVSPQNEHKDRWLTAKIALNDRLDALFGTASALPKALLIGERQDIVEETQDAFRMAGIAHVLAISGLHVGLLMGLLTWLLKRLSIGPTVRFFLVGAVLAVYCRFLGFQDSVVRASLMTMTLLSGQLLQRRRDILTSLSAAFLLILICKPLELLNAGFQLSFLAVAGIAITGDALSTLWKKNMVRAPRVLRTVIYAWIVSFAAWLWTAGILVNTFHSLSLAALIYSPLAVALLMVLMICYILTVFVSTVFMPTAGLLAAASTILTEGFIKTTDYVAHLPLATIRLPYIPLWWVAMIYGLLFLFSRYSLTDTHRKIWASIIALSLCVTISAVTYDGSVRYTLFSLGNADSAVIEDGKDTYVIDAGEHGGDLAAYLLARGRKIDKLFITHLHSDHYGGIEQLLGSHVPIEEIVLPRAALSAKDISVGEKFLTRMEQAGIPVRLTGAGEEGGSERTRFRILWPYTDKSHSDLSANDLSMAMRWRLEDITLLTTGDLPSRYEQYAAVPAQVLKAAHHGSKGATGESFLSVVDPDIVLVSDDGSERPRAINRRLRGKTVYHTADTGALTLLFTPGGIRIRPFLQGEETNHESR